VLELAAIEMILGIGMDLADVSRIETEISERGEGYASEMLLPSELAYCRERRRPGPFYAARFAAKGALFKALGAGEAGPAPWHDVEVVHDERGKPSLVLSGETMRRAGEMGVKSVHVSLTHLEGYAAAVVCLEG
jgi:holo-[acyl-carrier protein] synthase